ncbi:MAG: hypothetical protein OMM_15029, partial [Candidatus Magnetoglobus multicellularis str. Araruama]
MCLFSDGSEVIYTQLDGNKIRQRVIDFHKRLQQPQNIQRSRYLGELLHQWLIKPIEPQLKTREIDTLLIIPDSVFRLIPFAALSDPADNKYLIEKYAITTLPALSLMTANKSIENTQILLAGLSTPADHLSDLPYVSKELQAIQQIMGGKIIENADFTPENLKRELTNNNYNVLHFSTHSIFGANPKNTKLFMFDSSLTLDQLNELILMNMYRGNHVDLLTLSAC